MTTDALDPDELAARLQQVFAVPLHRFLAIRLADPDDPAAGVEFDALEPTLGNTGLVHGGVVSALLDVASYLALMPHFRPGEHAVTADMAVSLMRPVHEGATVRIAGTVVRRGRTLAFLRADATVDGRLVAAGQVTKTMIPPPA